MSGNILTIYNTVIVDYNKLWAATRKRLWQMPWRDKFRLQDRAWRKVGDIDKLNQPSSILPTMVRKLDRYSRGELEALKILMDANLQRHRGVGKINIIGTFISFFLGAIGVIGTVKNNLNFDIWERLKASNDLMDLIIVLVLYAGILAVVYLITSILAFFPRQKAELLSECITIAIANKHMQQK